MIRGLKKRLQVGAENSSSYTGGFRRCNGRKAAPLRGTSKLLQEPSKDRKFRWKQRFLLQLGSDISGTQPKLALLERISLMEKARRIEVSKQQQYLNMNT